MKCISEPNSNDLISNRALFDAFVYTPLEQAAEELEKRKNNQNLAQYISYSLPAGFLQNFKGHKNALLARQIATPNFELQQFSRLVDALPGFKKTIMTLHKDKFTPCNASKYHLGKIVCHDGNLPNGKKTSVQAVDFIKYNGKKLSDVETIWGQPLADFHNELLQMGISGNVTNTIAQLECSNWVSKMGKTAKEYYSKFLLLFLQNGILFENFLLKEKGETAFTQEVFLPAFMNVMKETGMKPLIVPFLPAESEGNNFWNCYPESLYQFVKNKVEAASVHLHKIAA